jgi:hypothetical protein
MVQKQLKIGGLRGFMSKLDEAEQRLQRAVAGLEEAARAVASSAPSAVSKAENAAAAPDPAVAAALETAQARNAELEDVNTVVAQRLDGAITRIKTILED